MRFAERMSNPGLELVDVIDDEGRTVGVVTRREMRQQNLPHRCVYILVFNRLGQLFVHQRTSTKDVYPSFWDVAVGGVLSAGESFDAGARREAEEELGVALEPVLLFPFRYSDGKTGVHAEAFRAVHDGPFRLQPEEIVRGEFLSTEQVLTRLATDRFCPDGVSVFEKFLCRSSP
jgi:isopentenyldiphosphate isomerase